MSVLVNNSPTAVWYDGWSTRPDETFLDEAKSEPFSKWICEVCVCMVTRVAKSAATPGYGYVRLHTHGEQKTISEGS